MPSAMTRDIVVLTPATRHGRSLASTLLQGTPLLLGEADLSADMISFSWKLQWGGPRYGSASVH